MANRFLSNIRINDAYTFPASDGSNGQVIVTDGSGNLAFADPSTSSSASVIYRDNFTGDGSTVAFTLQNSLSNEDQTFIYIDGVYQEKGTYSLSTNTITFTTAPDTGHSIEVISVSGINVGPTTIYQDNFTGDGTTTDFTLAQSIDNEVKTMIYFNGVYQFKGTYSLNGTALSFDTAPANGVDIEVISIASAAAADYNQKVLFYGKANEAISKGDAIMLAGQQGDHFLLAKATQAAIDANHEYFLGLASQDLVQGEFGYVTEFGKITELDTSGYTAGDILWFDAGGSTAGALTTTEPAAPLAKIQVAAVIRSHQNEGVLFIRPSWYHELGELHDVNVASVADKDILAWNNTQGYWENTKTLDSLTANTLSATTLTGTLSTAAQTNITSVGTLTSLDVSGDIRVNGTKILSTISSASYIWNNTDSLYVVDDTGNTVQLSIKDSGNVGINTSSPDSILHLHGDTTSWASSPTIIMSSSSTANANIRNWRIGPADTNYGNFHIGVSSTQGGIVDSDSEGSTFTIDYQGRVGIGTKSPSYKLDVSGGSTARFSDDVYIGTAWSGSYGPRNSSDDIKFQDWNSSRLMTITQSGNVGIGTSAPSNLLHIADDTATVSTTQLTLEGRYTGYGAGIDFVSRTSNGGTIASMAKITADGEDSWGTTASTQDAGLRFFTTLNGSQSERMRLTSAGQLQLPYGNASALNGGEGVITDPGTFTGMKLYGSSDGNLKIFNVRNNSSFGNILFLTGTGTERMRITDTGNVGIGTTSPAVPLHVNGFARFNGGIQLDGNNRTIYAIDNTSLILGTNNTERMRIDSAGNVGIGTTAPSHKLDVEGTDAYLINLNNTSTDTRLQFETSGTARGHLSAGTGLFTMYGNSGTALRFMPNGSTAMYINTSGNVGIGTTSPDKKLEIKTGSTATGVHYLQTIGGAYHTTGYAVGLGLDPEGYGNRNKIGIVAEGIGTGWSRGKLHFLLRGETGVSGEADLSHSRMVITDDTKVGIGTTTPDDGLHIYGVGNGNGVKIEATSGNYESAVLKLYPKSPNADERNWAIAAYKDSADDLSFSSSNVKGGNPYSSGTTRMIIEGTTGNVGINKTNPDYTLDVEGQVAFTDVILARSGTSSLTNADYWYQGKFTGSGSVHLKTSIGWGANTQMYSFHFLGHEYGQSKPIDAMLCFYNYPPQSTPISIGTSGTHSISIYQSSDGYIVFRLALGSGYYTGFTISSRNTAQGLAYPSIIATAQNTSATHF